jgi:hypothetical protein
MASGREEEIGREEPNVSFLYRTLYKLVCAISSFMELRRQRSLAHSTSAKLFI